jgi:histidine triad (HIT) family protein
MVKKEEKKEQPKKQACIFCNIVEGKEKSNVVYEDNSSVVIMDAFPVTEGHLLILPKKHKKDVLEMDEKETAEIFNLARKAGKILVNALEADSVNIASAPSVVQHFHLHVIPRYVYDMMGPLADLDNKRELPKEVTERLFKKLKEGFDAIQKVQ